MTEPAQQPAAEGETGPDVSGSESAPPPRPGAPAHPPWAADGSGLTPARARMFLEALREGDTVRRSAARAGVSNDTVYKRRGADLAFAELMEEAQRTGRQARSRLRERKRAPYRAMRYRLVQRDSDGS